MLLQGWEGSSMVEHFLTRGFSSQHYKIIMIIKKNLKSLGILPSKTERIFLTYLISFSLESERKKGKKYKERK